MQYVLSQLDSSSYQVVSTASLVAVLLVSYMQPGQQEKQYIMTCGIAYYILLVYYYFSTLLYEQDMSNTLNLQSKLWG